MSQVVRVAIDFSCAASYLAVAPTRALESRLATAFEWLPFPAVLWGAAKVVVADGDRSARHFRIRTAYIEKELRLYAESRGLDLGDINRTIDTTIASLGLLWLRRCDASAAGEYVARVFDRIWRDNREAEMNFIEKCLGAAASGFVDYARGNGPGDLDATRAQLSSDGVWNVPAYLVAGERFVGRQHLPMIERLASLPDAPSSSPLPRTAP
jgi:2-hydroxychromene-2-carboxylate isomerase